MINNRPFSEGELRRFAIRITSGIPIKVIARAYGCSSAKIIRALKERKNKAE